MASNVYPVTPGNGLFWDNVNGILTLVPQPGTGGIKFADGTTQTTAAAASPLTTKGDIYVYGSGNTRLPIGSDTQVLTADHTQATGMKWAAAGGSSGVPSGTPIFIGGAVSPNTNNGFNGWTLAHRIYGSHLTAVPAAWNFSITINTAVAVVNTAVVRRTARGSTTYIDSTGITWGGLSNPTLAIGNATSDNISLQLDQEHDYYILIYFDPSTSASMAISDWTDLRAGSEGGFQSGNQTAAATFTGYTGFNGSGITYIYRANAQ